MALAPLQFSLSTPVVDEVVLSPDPAFSTNTLIPPRARSVGCWGLTADPSPRKFFCLTSLHLISQASVFPMTSWWVSKGWVGVWRGRGTKAQLLASVQVRYEGPFQLQSTRWERLKPLLQLSCTSTSPSALSCFLYSLISVVLENPHNPHLYANPWLKTNSGQPLKPPQAFKMRLRDLPLCQTIAP